MKAHIDFQIIEKDGHPAFAVVPYDDFMDLIADETEDSDNAIIPHEVVKANLLDGKSLIRAWREYLGFSQKVIAQKMGITQAALSQIEKQNSKPRATTLEKLANALGIDRAQLTD